MANMCAEFGDENGGVFRFSELVVLHGRFVGVTGMPHSSEALTIMLPSTHLLFL